MTRRVYWGLAFLIILLAGVSAVLLMRDTDTEPEVVFNPLSPKDEEQVKRNIQDIIKKEKTPTTRPGYKKVQHGDHYHEVPIAKTDPASQNVKSVAPAPKTKSGGLTYHAGLLETNPAEALYQQAIERGHWSAKWIPPFPPEDTEAQEFARNLYLCEYYKSIDDKENPINVQAIQDCVYQLRAVGDMSTSTLKSDLLKLTWASVPAGSVIVDWADPLGLFSTA